MALDGNSLEGSWSEQGLVRVIVKIDGTPIFYAWFKKKIYATG